MFVLTYICVRTCMYMGIYTNVHTYIAHVSLYVNMRIACVCVNIYIYIYIYIYTPCVCLRVSTHAHISIRSSSYIHVFLSQGSSKYLFCGGAHVRGHVLKLARGSVTTCERRCGFV